MLINNCYIVICLTDKWSTVFNWAFIQCRVESYFIQTLRFIRVFCLLLICNCNFTSTEHPLLTIFLAATYTFYTGHLVLLLYSHWDFAMFLGFGRSIFSLTDPLKSSLHPPVLQHLASPTCISQTQKTQMCVKPTLQNTGKTQIFLKHTTSLQTPQSISCEYTKMWKIKIFYSCCIR